MSDVAGRLVGRDRELGLLATASERANQGVGQTVVIVGPQGIGKSALLGGLEDLAATGGAVVVHASGDAQEVDVSSGVVDQLMTRLGARSGGGSKPSVVGAGLVEACRAIGSPMALVIDDSHWADQFSLCALSFAVRRLDVSEVLVVLACEEGAEAGLPEGLVKLAGGDSGATVRLRGLDAEALGRLLEPSVGVLAPEQLVRLHEHTRGHPGHALALARDLDVARLGREPAQPLPAPEAVVNSVRARMKASRADGQALAFAASVVGETCSIHDAVILSGIDDVDAVLEAMAGMEILERDGPCGLRFCDPMTRSAVYYEITSSRAAELHRRAAGLTDGQEALRHRLRAATGSDLALAAEAEDTADSLAETGAWSEAARWMDAATGVSATRREAERCRWTAALYRLYGGDPGTGAALVGAETRLDLRAEHPVRLLLAGMVAAGECRYGDGRVLLNAAWELIDPTVEVDTASRIALRMSDCLQGQLRAHKAVTWAMRAVEVLPPDGHLLGEDPLTDLAFALMGAGRVAEAEELVATRVPAGRGANTPGLLAAGLVGLFTDRLGLAMEDLSDAADHYLRVGPPHKYIEAQCLLAEVEYRRGLWDFSASHAQEAVSAAHKRGIPQLIALALAVSAGVAAARGDGSAAESALDEALAALALRGSYQALGWTWIGRARLETARGNPQGVIDALSTVASVSDAFSAVDDQVMAPWRALYGLALSQLGRIEEASDQADRLTLFASARRAPSALGSAARLRGGLAALRGDVDTANVELSEAIELFEAIPMPYEAAQARLDLGRELRRAGRRREAAGHLEAARAVFARLESSPFVERCDTELASCGLRLKRELSEGAMEALTAAEETVAELVAQGATNRQVADMLNLSVRTVEHHLRRVYAKVGVGSRSQLAALRGQAGVKAS